SIMADTSPQNASMHLAKLIQAELVAVESQGRHKYYRLAGEEIAAAIEAIANLVPKSKAGQAVYEGHDHAMKYCRTCYNHLAGKVGVLVTESMLRKKIIRKEPENRYVLTKLGEDFFARLKIELESLKTQRRPLLRPCLDWTERTHHMAGLLGAAFLNKILADDWVRKVANSRAVIITAKGQKEFYERLEITV
ncbi:MAG TPA: winged helix-turn-helix domain-containing protein, partial [Cyclobacteriaceae bacterium]|nr:winged helix-turn-helix domain-containing protein [Cyclobacteriaceae bacterium]